ncbi:hypothetical protein DPMN_112313 [Dreissena polymorpha]|uniref:Uncharacterized protein n=1 Tax=Dreissena polymorpha TaxID=45954 RepID=A0A9D4KFV5_DREPO|nr:hypothetical protein DPMN_112313 [Dreissena polymorpha]
MPTLKEMKDLMIKYVMFCVTVPPRRRQGTAIVIPVNVAVPLAVPVALLAAPVLAPAAVEIVRPLLYFYPGPGGDCIDVSIHIETPCRILRQSCGSHGVSSIICS